jgi:hypothetical protein
MKDRDAKMQPRDCSHTCTTGQEPRRLLVGRVPSSPETRAHVGREGSRRLEPASPTVRRDGIWLVTRLRHPGFGGSRARTCKEGRARLGGAEVPIRILRTRSRTVMRGLVDPQLPTRWRRWPRRVWLPAVGGRPALRWCGPVRWCVRPDSHGQALRHRHAQCTVHRAMGHEMLKAALTWDIIPCQSGFSLVGVTGFEPATSSSRTTRATKLRHTPIGPEAEVESSPSRAWAHIGFAWSCGRLS